MTEQKKGTVSIDALKMALEKQKQKYEAELAEARQPAEKKVKRDGQPYNNVPRSKRERRFTKQLDKVLRGAESGKLRGKMHGDSEVIGQTTIRNYLKAEGLPCGSDAAATLQNELEKAGLVEFTGGKYILIHGSKAA